MRELVAAAEREVLQIAMGHVETGFTSVKHELQGAFEYIEKVQSNEVIGVRVGYDDLAHDCQRLGSRDTDTTGDAAMADLCREPERRDQERRDVELPQLQLQR